MNRFMGIFLRTWFESPFIIMDIIIIALFDILKYLKMLLFQHPAFICPKSTLETPEQLMKS